jgi:predicted peroxiredoxin
MKKNYVLAFLLLLCLKTAAQKQFHTVLKNGGAIYEVPEAEPIADLSMPYKMVFELFTNADKIDTIHPGLDKMARLVNLHRYAGVKKENFELAIFIHQTATPIVLSDEAHKKRYGVPNPNTRLINEMVNNGVKIYVCGQSLYKRKLAGETRNPNIKVVLSAMVGISTLLSKGYVLMP